MKLSYSKITTYLSCPLNFRFIYVDRLSQPVLPYHKLGNLLHKTLKEYHRLRKDRLPSLSEVPSFYREKWGKIPESQTKYFLDGREMLVRYYYGTKAEEEREEIKHPPELPPFPERYDIPSIGNMLAWSNKMMLHLVRQMDITLKERCPECGGDLVENIVFNDSTQEYELRLRCKQQNKPKCQQVDFYIHDLT